VDRFELRVGDVFSVPIDDTRVGVGQVVATEEDDAAQYLAIFDAVAPNPDLIDIDQALQERLIFLALSYDGKLYNGHWAIVGNRPVAERIPLPAWREANLSKGEVDVVDYSGRHRRPASEAEADLLRDRHYYAPAILERALRAKHGLEPWQQRYSDMAPDEVATTRRMFGFLDRDADGRAVEDKNDSTVEQRVFAYFALTEHEFGTETERDMVLALEEQVDALAKAAGVGGVGGNEFGNGEAVLFLYGPDADALCAVVEHALREVSLRPARVELCYGDPHGPTTRITL
jgi:hypothetical protein